MSHAFANRSTPVSILHRLAVASLLLSAPALAVETDAPPAAQPAPAAQTAPVADATTTAQTQAAPEGSMLRFGSGVIDRPGIRGVFAFSLWATSMYGDVSGAGHAASVDESFIDIVQNADSVFGFDGRLEIGSGRFSGYIDGTYMKVGFDNRGDPVDPADVTNEISIVEFGMIFRVGEIALDNSATPTDLPPSRVLGLDIYAGGRYTDVGLQFDLASGASDDRSKNWTSPLIGSRVTIDLSERWNLTIGGDIGGFGIGSQFEWAASAMFYYHFDMWGANAAFAFGYRALGEDFVDDRGGPAEFKWDIILYGPVIGLTISF